MVGPGSGCVGRGSTFWSENDIRPSSENNTPPSHDMSFLNSYRSGGGGGGGRVLNAEPNYVRCKKGR
jgi:hypothetical protein